MSHHQTKPHANEHFKPKPAFDQCSQVDAQMAQRRGHCRWSELVCYPVNVSVLPFAVSVTGRDRAFEDNNLRISGKLCIWINFFVIPLRSTTTRAKLQER